MSFLNRGWRFRWRRRKELPVTAYTPRNIKALDEMKIEVKRRKRRRRGRSTRLVSPMYITQVKTSKQLIPDSVEPQEIAKNISDLKTRYNEIRMEIAKLKNEKRVVARKLSSYRRRDRSRRRRRRRGWWFSRRGRG